MILKSCILVAFLSVGCFASTYASTYSRIYLQNGASLIPIEYAYGTPGVQIANQELARLSAPPQGSIVPVPQAPNFVTACVVAPCIIPNQGVPPVVNSRVVAYKPTVPANVPIVVAAPNQDQSSYEYSYVVYDQNTGDQKAQRELSDGGVVRGQYSFIQPDGYVREVQYTADDEKGFNAVVKKFLPEDANKANIVALPPSYGNEEEQKPAVTPKIESNDIVENPVKEDIPIPNLSPSDASAELDGVVVASIEPVKSTAAPTDILASVVPIGNLNFATFSDIFRCVQEALKKNNSGATAISPLNYILFPSKPC